MRMGSFYNVFINLKKIKRSKSTTRLRNQFLLLLKYEGLGLGWVETKIFVSDRISWEIGIIFVSDFKQEYKTF